MHARLMQPLLASSCFPDTGHDHDDSPHQHARHRARPFAGPCRTRIRTERDRSPRESRGGSLEGRRSPGGQGRAPSRQHSQDRGQERRGVGRCGCGRPGAPRSRRGRSRKERCRRQHGHRNGCGRGCT
ncbi:hypothetical protein DWG18_10170 [Lysobacter sp. TY2-98]|nr:hypothetical protein DWG18_10170 [Lysobacter sp. TY2-98]